MSHCAVRGCTNTWRRRNEWLDRECFVHQPAKKRHCSCAPLFSFHQKPNKEEDSRMWLKALNLKNPPKKVFVCCHHFVDKKPTPANPYPELWLGYECLPQRKRRKLQMVTGCPASVPEALKRFDPNLGLSQSVSHGLSCAGAGSTTATGGSSRKPIMENFRIISAAKERSMISRSHNQSIVNKTVQINVGLKSRTELGLKTVRDTLLPLEVKPHWSADHVLAEATKTQQDFNQDLEDEEYVLIYPDGSQVKTIPGTNIAFTVERYKAAVRKSYQSLTLCICTIKDFLSDSGVHRSHSDDTGKQDEVVVKLPHVSDTLSTSGVSDMAVPVKQNTSPDHYNTKKYSVGRTTPATPGAVRHESALNVKTEMYCPFCGFGPQNHPMCCSSCGRDITHIVEGATERNESESKSDVPDGGCVKTMLAVCVDVPGGPKNMLLRTVPRPQPKDGEVLIKVHATALNRADILQRRGLYPPPPGESEILGLEVAGTVAAVGSGVKGGWAPCDRVMALLCGGGYAEYVAVPEELLMPISPHLTICQAAAIPEAWLTAFQLLLLVAQVKEGEVVLVHAGASGVGTAAVQLARLFGAVPIVTAGSPEKLKMAESLGAAAGFNYKKEDFAGGVHAFTEGRGANVILDCIGGNVWEKNLSCLATDGRWVLYGTMGGKKVEGDLLGKLLSKRGHLLSSLLRSRSLQYKADLVKAFSQRALHYFSGQPATLRPVIDNIFNLEDIAEAHKHMEANRNMGKIVINVNM